MPVMSIAIAAGTGVSSSAAWTCA